MKTAIALLLSLVAFTSAFTNGPSVVGKAVPRLSENNVAFQQQPQQQAREKDTALSNALREFANWNDVWDGDYGYGGYGGMGGGYGPYRSGYRRGGYG